MNDDELRASLARRASATLSADDRNDILRAARLDALKPTPRGRPNLFPRVAGYLVGAVAVIVLILIALPILLSPPTVAGPSPNPSDAGQPTRRVVQVPPSLGEQSPSPTPSSGPHIYSAQQLAGLIGDPNWVGKTVLADLPAGAIGHDPCASPLGTPVISCNLGSLNVHGPHSTVVVGLRDATAGDGRQNDEGNGYIWVKQLEWPMQAGTYAFQVNSSDVDYLGPAHPSNGTPTSVADTAKTASDPSDDVYVVSGWLGHTLPAPCAFPQQGLESPMPDISSYYCGGSWLADQQWDPPTSGLSIDGGMHVQNDAYDTYAPNAETGGAGGASRFGTYLVRNAGCPEVVTGDCPVWRMVGRLDDDNATHEPGITPSPTVSITSLSMPPGIDLESAIGLARPNVAPADATVWGYAVGTYRDVLNLTPDAGRVLQPPDGATWDTLVWGIQFEGTFDICPPPPPAGQTPNPCESRPGISTVYLDYTNGTWLTTAAFSPSPGSPLPAPFYILPQFGSPAPT